MVSRFHHLITDQFVAPTSDAIASREAHKSMIDLNEVKAESLSMSGLLGLSVPNIKAKMSHDLKSPVGHSGLMSNEAEKIAESEWRKGFQARVREAQGERKGKDIAKLLGISHDQYRKYVSGGDNRTITVMPPRLLTRFCLITDRDLTWLIDGPETIEEKKPARATKPKPTTATSKRRAAGS
jgi:hypothetical protein